MLVTFIHRDNSELYPLVCTGYDEGDNRKSYPLVRTNASKTFSAV